jgi:hypothetical protein
MDKWLKRLLFASGALCLLALATLAGVGVYQSLTLPKQSAKEITTRLDRLESTVGEIKRDYLKTTGAVRDGVGVVVGVVKTLPGMLDKRVQSIQSDANNQLTTALDKADKQLTATNDSVKALVDSTKLTLDAWASISKQVDEVARYNLTCVDMVGGQHNPRCWPSQITGIMGGTKTGLGEWALTMRTLRKSQGDFLELGKGIGNNVERTTDNLAVLTKPDSWMVKGAKIAAPIVGGFVWGKIAK